MTTLAVIMLAFAATVALLTALVKLLLAAPKSQRNLP